MTIGSATSASVAPHQLAARAAEEFGKAPASLVRDIEAAAARLMSDAAAANLSASGTGPALPDGAPQLHGPDYALAFSFLPGGEEAARRMTPEALLMELMGELMVAIQKSSNESMQARVKVAREALAQQQAAYERLVEAAAGTQAQVDADTQAATEAGEEAQRLLTLATGGSERVEQLQATLDALPAEDPERAAVEAELEVAQRELVSLREAAQVATTAYEEALEAVAASQAELNGHFAEVDELRKLVLPGIALPQARTTNNAELTKLMATLSQVVTQAQEAKVKFEYKVMMEQLKHQEAENTRRAEEHKKELEKAQHTNKIASCFAKIAGYILGAIMLFTSILTGGATAAIGVGLFIALAALEVAGVDVVGKILEPLMEHVIKPLAQAVGKLVTDILKGLGVDPRQADMAGQVFGAIYAVCVMICVAVVAVAAGKSVGGKIAAKLGPMVSNLFSRMAPAIMQAASRLSAQAATVTARVAGEKAAVYAARATVVASASSLGVQAATSGANIAAGVHQVRAAEWLAAVERGLHESETIRDHMRVLQEHTTDMHDFVHALVERMSDIARESSQAASGMLANLQLRNA